MTDDQTRNTEADAVLRYAAYSDQQLRDYLELLELAIRTELDDGDVPAADALRVRHASAAFALLNRVTPLAA